MIKQLLNIHIYHHQLGLSHREHSIPDFLQPNYLNLFNNNEQIKTRDDDRKLKLKQTNEY